MCSQFLKRMDNYQGDLTDILRASGTNPVGQGSTAALPDWQFPANYPACPPDDFGLPFLRDPLLHEIDSTPISGFFQNSDIIKDETAGFATVGDHHDQMKRPPNIFSRMLQISPTTKLPPSPELTGATRGAKAPPMLVCNDRSVMNSSKSCLVESQALQISSPRNTGIRRRKSQAKKVVCIPAPAPANSKSSGEVVPSDLWAWRKYGQKPIKGSPYPRGYYRCSSSKGCSARKQVERSRTDPNMLVITYTSEHNHPWPTQRNALAGSTRSQPSKTSTAQKHSPPKSTKEEESTNSAAVKEENMDQDFDLKMDDADQFDHQGFPQSYKPVLPDSNQSEDSFFADLGEIEADSLDMLLFDGRDSKGLDPFGFYDWAGGATAAASTSSPGSCSGAGSGATRTDS